MGTYRAKPPVAAWIAQERRRQGWKAGDLAARLATIGVQVTEQTIRVWESNADRKPSPANLDALERLFGSQAPERPATGESDVAQAIREQTAMLERLLTPLLLELQARATPSPSADAATQELADRLIGPRRDPDPVPSGRP